MVHETLDSAKAALPNPPGKLNVYKVEDGEKIGFVAAKTQLGALAVYSGSRGVKASLAEKKPRNVKPRKTFEERFQQKLDDLTPEEAQKVADILLKKVPQPETKGRRKPA